MIAAIDGHDIAAAENWYPLLNHKTGELIRLSLKEPGSEKECQETVKPISLRRESELIYERWVRGRRADVDRLSGGRLGYAHIRYMSDSRFREIFEDFVGKAVEKEGILLNNSFERRPRRPGPQNVPRGPSGRKGRMPSRKSPQSGKATLSMKPSCSVRQETF